MPIDWGSVPDWLAGGGATAALLWARKAAIAAARTDERQGIQLAAFEQDRKRAQAERVAVWFDYTRDNKAHHRLVMRNASNLPVYELLIWINVVVGDVRAPKELSEQDSRFITRYVYCLPPNETVTESLDEAPVGVPLYSDTERFTQYVFRDSSGSYWKRPSGAALLGITPEEDRRLRTEVRLRSTSGSAAPALPPEMDGSS
jgi:hypothetical protein